MRYKSVPLWLLYVCNFDAFEQHEFYENMIMKLAEKGKILSTLDEFLSKNVVKYTYILFYFIFNCIYTYQ